MTVDPVADPRYVGGRFGPRRVDRAVRRRPWEGFDVIDDETHLRTRRLSGGVGQGPLHRDGRLAAAGDLLARR